MQKKCKKCKNKLDFIAKECYHASVNELVRC